MFRRKRPKPVYAPKPRISKGQTLAIWERYLERGLHFFDKGKHDEALADLDEAIRSSPRNAELYATRGMILAEMGDEEAAHEDLDYAAKLDDRQWVVHYLRGLLAYRRKHHDEAIEHLSQAQRYAPLRPEILYARAVVNYDRGQLKRAQDDMDSAVQLMKDGDKRQRAAKKFLNRVKREIKGNKK